MSQTLNVNEKELTVEEKRKILRDKWVKYTKHEPLTRTKSEFLDHLIDNVDMLKQIGTLESVFLDFYKFIKHFNKD